MGIGKNDEGYIRIAPLLNPLYFGYNNSKGFTYKVKVRMVYNFNDNNEMVRYSGFKASGTKKGLFPKGVTEKGEYVTLIEGLPELLFDESDERSEFSSRLESTMKAQAFNNPVLVFYNIK